MASQETYGTLGAIVRSQTGSRQVGFLTNRHVAVDLDYPSQKMFHPLPPNLGPGVYLGAVERATSFITDDLWYGIFAGINPGSAFYLTVYTYSFSRCLILPPPYFGCQYLLFRSPIIVVKFRINNKLNHLELKKPGL